MVVEAEFKSDARRGDGAPEVSRGFAASSFSRASRSPLLRRKHARYVIYLFFKSRSSLTARESLAGTRKKSRGAKSFSGASAVGVLARDRVDIARIIFVRIHRHRIEHLSKKPHLQEVMA